MNKYGKWGFHVLSGGKYHKKTGQRSQELKPLHVLEDPQCLNPHKNADSVRTIPALFMPTSPMLTGYLAHRRCLVNIHSTNEQINQSENTPQKGLLFFDTIWNSQKIPESGWKLGNRTWPYAMEKEKNCSFKTTKQPPPSIFLPIYY